MNFSIVPLPPPPRSSALKRSSCKCAFQQQGDSKQVDAFSCILEKSKRYTSVFSLCTTTKHSWKNAQTRLCYFSALLCYFFPRGHASTVFPFCCKNWHRRWMNRHPGNLRSSQTCILMVFHAFMRQISNYWLCAISLSEFLSLLFLHTFSKYATKIFTSWEIGDIENEVEEFGIAGYLWCPRVPESQSV